MVKSTYLARMFRDWRSEKGLTQRQAAVYVGISKASISRIEREVPIEHNISTLTKLAKVLNIEIIDLVD